MATPQMRQISSGTASCPLFLTNFSICAGTLTYVSLIHQDNPPSRSLEELPQSKEASSPFTKKLLGFFPPLSKLSFKLFWAAQHRFLQLTLLLEREMWNRLRTHTHMCTQNTGKVASCWRRRCISLWLTATRVQWQS